MNMPHWVKSPTDHTLSVVDSCCLYLGISPDVIIRLQFPFFFFIYCRPSSGLWSTNRKAFERFSKVLITLPWFSLFRSPLSLILSHTLHHFILFCYNKDSQTEHSSDGGVSIWQAVACTKWNVQMRNRERERERERENLKEESGIIIREMPFSWW